MIDVPGYQRLNDSSGGLVTGLGMDNLSVIETKTGIVVIDGGATDAYAKKAIGMLPEEVSSKPVRGIIYTHWHYIFGAHNWNIQDNTIVVAHKNHEDEKSATFGDESIMSEVRGVRMGIQLGSYLPAEGPDSPSKTGLLAQNDSHQHFLF